MSAQDPLASSEAAPSDRLSLRQALALALENSRTLARAGLERESERFDLRVAEDEFRPNLDLTGSSAINPVRNFGPRVTNETARVGAAVSQRLPTGARLAVVWDNRAFDASNNANPVYTTGLLATVEQPLLRGAGVDVNLANLRIARLLARDGEMDFRRVLINTLTNVIFAYRSLAYAEAAYAISDRALGRAQEQLRINRALVGSGILPPVEIIQTEADIANQELNVLAAQSAVESARVALIRLLDLEHERPLVAADPFTLPDFDLPVEECLKLAYANRPDYQQVLRAHEIAQQVALVARNNERWSVGVGSSYRLAGEASTYPRSLDRTWSRDREDWAVGLTFHVPLGDLTRRQAHVRARVRLAQAELDVAEVTENVQLDVRDGLRRIVLARERVRVAAVARELAATQLELEKGKLQTGRTTNFTVVSFQNDLLRARLGELAAQVEYLNTLTGLDQALGTTLHQWGISVIDLDAAGPARAQLAP